MVTWGHLPKRENDNIQVDSGPTRPQSREVVVGSSVFLHDYYSVPTASPAADSALRKHREAKVLVVSAQQHATVARVILLVMVNQILKVHGIVIEDRGSAGDQPSRKALSLCR